MMLTRRSLLATSAAAGALAAAPLRAQSAMPVKMILNWRYQGPQGWFFLAEDRGYFADAGVEMTMDQGSGSGAAVGSVAGGGYDMGFGDINALIQLAADKPEEAPIAVYVMYNRPPFTVAVKADSDIHTAKDLEGRKLGGAANDGALKLWPAFADVAGIDTSGVEVLNFQPSLREQMLRTGEVEGVFGFVNTIRFSAMLSGMDPDKEIRFINYGDYGMDLYSNALIVSKRLAEEHPEQVRGVVAAIDRGIRDTLADPDAAIDAVARREALIDKRVEKLRLMATLSDEMGHPEIAEFGLGMPDPERLKKAIDIVVKANGLSRTPALDEVFTDAFLPPMADRITSLG
ncbi:ABC transporter substrate-binding protein [Rubrimonas cliftonensis]|uniref:NitT/TauT family transport system substrate-binding protein n=1 Tax=Rubrimonas cliftonensis TaxID=89524 RepID=A0A1H4AAJ6_9RHOB|nr:ABC transporter substrate-binding protein [Rubrimonas cliftonensis]SEA32920.1 NitT/TauT family transport system substrate-binding protein [Rubrimonas cliftonensis]